MGRNWDLGKEDVLPKGSPTKALLAPESKNISSLASQGSLQIRLEGGGVKGKNAKDTLAFKVGEQVQIDFCMLS